MKLCQGQIWKSGKQYIRIVKLERLAVAYKSMPNLGNKEGTLHQTSKKISAACSKVPGCCRPQRPQSRRKNDFTFSASFPANQIMFTSSQCESFRRRFSLRLNLWQQDGQQADQR